MDADHGAPMKEKKKMKTIAFLTKTFGGKSKKAKSSKNARPLKTVEDAAPILHKLISFVEENGKCLHSTLHTLPFAKVSLVYFPHRHILINHLICTTCTGSTVEGILRISGSFEQIKALKEEISKGMFAKPLTCS